MTTVVVKAPLIIMFEGPDGYVACNLHPRAEDDHRTYGLLICDVVRHVAKCFKVDEEDVWEWVEKEREHPTTPIIQVS